MSPMSKYLWKLYFSEKLDPAQSLPARVSVVNARRIDQITAVPNGNQTYRVDNDDVVVNTWRLSWDFSGVVGFDISYSINGGAPVVVATNYSRSNYIFPFTSSVESYQTFETIRFIVKSSADPVAISTISKSYSVDCTASGVETVTDKNIVHDSSTIRISVDTNDGSVINIVNDYISELLPRDKYSVTIKKELLDDRGVTFNDFVDKTLSWSVLDDLRIVTTNIHPGVLADPNDVVIRFNRELDVFTMAYYCSNTTEYVIIPATEYKMRIIDDVVSIAMSGAYGEYKNYKLMINSAVDYNGNGLRRSAEIEFHSNHAFEPPTAHVYLEDIDNLRNNLSASLTMTQDLDFNNPLSYNQSIPGWEARKLAWTAGTGWTPIGYDEITSNYTGIFDGNSFSIKNLTISSPSYNESGALFYGIEGTVKNLGVADAVINSGFASVLACVNAGTVINCFVTGNITNDLGGETTEGAGFIANNQGTITNCYSAVTISGHSNNGSGFVNYNDGTIWSCYYNSTMAGFSDIGKGTPKTTSEMKQQATYTGWDFSSIWQINEGVDYPTFIPPYETPTTD